MSAGALGSELLSEVKEERLDEVCRCYKGHDDQHSSIHMLTGTSFSIPSELSMHRKINTPLVFRLWTTSSQSSIPRNQLVKSSSSIRRHGHPIHTTIPLPQSLHRSSDSQSSSSPAQPPAQARPNSSTTSPPLPYSQLTTPAVTSPSPTPKPPSSSSTSQAPSQSSAYTTPCTPASPPPTDKQAPRSRTPSL